MDRQKRRGYIVAVSASLLILLLRSALSQVLVDQAPFLPFVLPVIAASWLGGLGPGLLATALGTLFGLYYFVPPSDSLWLETIGDGLNALFFVSTSATISVLCEALHEARRRDAERRFQTLADLIPQLVWMARPDGSRFWHNKRWYEYTGMQRGQSDGQGWQSAIDPTQLSGVLNSWTIALKKGEPWEAIYPLRRSDGEMRWHLSRAVPVRNDEGDIDRWFGTGTDISDRMEIEQKLKDADCRKDEFLATLAHELRNPLSPISNALQIWPLVMDDKAELEHLREIMARQVRQMIRLIDDLLDVSRITRGKIRLRQQPVDVRTLITSAVESVQPLIDACEHRLTISTPAVPLFVNGDAVRLTQVLANILSNAAKYTGRKGEIGLAAETRGDNVVVTIRDNGPGIPGHMLLHVFDLFRQVDQTLDRSHGGLGIGLTLVKQLTELHNGTVEARSEGPGKGSQFIVTLPTIAAATQQRESERTPEDVKTLPRHRILVVDDFRESAETLATMLQGIGQDVWVLDDAMTAIEWIFASHPDVVFLDIAMPGMDGYAIARSLRESEELRETVLVALTGYGQPGDRRRAFEAGFDHHITKPATIEGLKRLLVTLPVRAAHKEVATN